MVPRRGLEPPRPFERRHLKTVRLPIPPPGHFLFGACCRALAVGGGANTGEAGGCQHGFCHFHGIFFSTAGNFPLGRALWLIRGIERLALAVPRRDETWCGAAGAPLLLANRPRWNRQGYGQRARSGRQAGGAGGWQRLFRQPSCAGIAGAWRASARVQPACRTRLCDQGAGQSGPGAVPARERAERTLAGGRVPGRRCGGQPGRRVQG